MTILLKPFLGCNISCTYCYQGDFREGQKPKMRYDVEAILKTTEHAKNTKGDDIVLHGGEPLTMPKKDVDAFLAKAYELQGRSGVQTNGTKIDDEFIAMFKKYKTHVGISYDGPGELSEFREGSEHVKDVFPKLYKEGVSCSTIAVVSRANAGTPERFEKFKQHVVWLSSMRIYGRLNPTMYEGEGNWALEKERAVEVYVELAKLNLSLGNKWSPFNDIINGLQNKSRVCIFSGCDPFHTTAATVITGDGGVTNCMRVNREGILMQHPAYHDTRGEILANVSQEHGGCKDCRYFSGCRGGCSGSVIDGDWRNRTEVCHIWKAVFGFYENVLRGLGVPINISTKPLPRGNTAGNGCANRPPENSHGDHHDSRGVQQPVFEMTNTPAKFLLEIPVNG
ncbi:MAG: radical SAM protein [Elusimicrobia bacterium]|nr:radical SAM protein [Elusimicrobiota bacterium]